MAGYHFGCEGRKLPCLRIRSLMRQLFHYGLVGVVSNAIGFAAYLVITALGVSPEVSMTIVYVVAATVGFLGHRRLTFGHQGNVLGAGFRFVIAHCFGYSINLIILVVMVDRLGYAHQLVQAFAIFVVAGFLFLTFKFFVFTDNDETYAEKS